MSCSQSVTELISNSSWDKCFYILYRCTCGNCLLERLQNAGECLKLLPRNREMRRISIKWWRFPGSRDNSTMRDNASRFQHHLSELLITALGCSKIWNNRWTEISPDWIETNVSNFFSAIVSSILWSSASLHISQVWHPVSRSLLYLYNYELSLWIFDFINLLRCFLFLHISLFLKSILI